MTKKKNSRQTKTKISSRPVTTISQKATSTRRLNWLAYNWPLVALLLLVLICLLAGSYAYDYFQLIRTLPTATVGR